MSQLSNYFSLVASDFKLWLKQGRLEPIEQNKHTAKLLIAFGLATWLLALVLYVIDGYHAGFLSINAWAATMSPVALHLLTSFGDGVFVLALMLLFAHKRVPLLYCILIAGLLSGLIAQLIKRSLDFGRPPSVFSSDEFVLVGKALKSKSFPSGHTTTAFLTASVLILWTDKRWLKFGLAVLAVLAGMSRIWLGVHWPIDVLVGAGIGTLVGVWAWHTTIKRQQKISAFAILFALLLLVLASFGAIFDDNDYHHAQWLISITGAVALWKSAHFFLLRKSGLAIRLDKQQTLAGLQLSNAELIFIVVLIVTLAYRILVIMQPHLTLFYDEAYYYHWSLQPELGYYSKPPMVAWFIHLFTSLFGSSVTSVKLAAPFLYAGSAVFVYLSAKRLAGSESALIAGLLLLFAPVVGFNSEFITTDAPLFLFWSLTIYASIRALEKHQLRWWLLVGISCGLGMLSKYTMAVLPASIFLCLLYDKDSRSVLKSYKPWLAAVIAGLLFALNLWWNADHHWVAFAHTGEISQQDKAGLNIVGTLEFLAGQLFVFGPLACVLFWLARKQIKKRLDEQRQATLLLLFSCFGILLVIGLQALSSRAFVNWAATWIIAASILVGLSLSFNRNGKLIKYTLISQILLLSAFYHWPQLQQHFGIEASKKNNPYQRVLGWEGVAKQLEPIRQRYPEAKLASSRRDLLAYIGFHAFPGEKELYRWNPKQDNIRDHYDLKYNLRTLKDTDQDFIFVSSKPLAVELLARFDKAEYLGQIEQEVFKDKRHRVYIYYLQGFNGYE
ncbi:glycosyltransferase family 39 protein [Agaribacterium haliotis]|uniref:glycosyltransferase family 39 protein n=1 Tax=Agaribacterium haliotis TaxID=2013869 RepID=UPI000BB57E52|nr:glycosyltransferase family 39 protein [Agaribacterium haliotis]